MVKSTNYYQLKKVKNFLNERQRNSLVTSFNDSQFRSLVTISEVRVWKSKKQKNSLIARVWIAEELFYSNYPFLLPDFFRNKNTKDEFQVQFEILKVFYSILDFSNSFIFHRPSRNRTYIGNLEGFCPNPLDDRP